MFNRKSKETTVLPPKPVDHLAEAAGLATQATNVFRSAVSKLQESNKHLDAAVAESRKEIAHHKREVSKHEDRVTTATAAQNENATTIDRITSLLGS